MPSDKILVTSETHPEIIAALNCVAGDSGGLELPVREIPRRWEEYLSKIEETLAGLSKKDRAPESPELSPHVKPHEFYDSEFYTFCNGEYNEMSAITNRSLEHARANVFLYDFYEDWTYTTDVGHMSPKNMALRRRIEWLEEIQRESAEGLTLEQEQELNQLRMSLT